MYIYTHSLTHTYTHIHSHMYMYMYMYAHSRTLTHTHTHIYTYTALVGVLTLLKFPYPRCVEEPETYDMVRVHAEWGAAANRTDNQKPTFAVSEYTCF